VEKDYDRVGDFNHENENLRVYSRSEDDKTWVALLSEDRPVLAMEHTTQRITFPIDGLVNLNIWNFKLYHGLIWRWFEKKILPEEPVILSDKAQTDKGLKFWKRLFDEYVKSMSSHKMVVLRFNSGEIEKMILNSDQLDDYTGSEDRMFNFRFALIKTA
jgi:hypothetical protein